MVCWSGKVMALMVKWYALKWITTEATSFIHVESIIRRKSKFIEVN